MRRTVPLLIACALVAGALAPTPAGAAFGVVVSLPEPTVYSPYGGPATVTFTFGPGDPATVFTVRLRRPGHGVVKRKDYLVDPATHASPHAVQFRWKSFAVPSPTDLVVNVRRQSGGPVITSETFTLLPKLVTDLSATPSTFYPVLQDGYKDTTRIGFSLSADTSATSARVFEADAYGRCCGAEIRSGDLGPLASGARSWVWDGDDDGSSLAATGTYFVKISATDTDGFSKTSKAQKVELATGTVRLMATKEKNGSAYAKVGPVQAGPGGDCYVERIAGTTSTSILCSIASVTVEWKWALQPGERIERVSWVIDGGYYGCHKKKSHTKTRSILRVYAPPTSTCTVSKAKIKYSYPVPA